MLPDSDNKPASLAKTGVCVGIARSIALHLLRPVSSVSLRREVMLRATVPKAAIQEDRNPLPGEHDVGGPPQLLKRWCADTKTEAPSVQLGPERSFRRSVAGASGAHGFANCIGRGPARDHEQSVIPFLSRRQRTPQSLMVVLG
jgi:hypothetical protein